MYATAGVSKANHIHSGHCVDLGGVVYPLTNMTDGISVTTVDATLTSWQTGGFAINLHKTDDPSIYTSCGNIPVSASPVIALSEMNNSGQTGIAILTARGDKTEVVLLATAGISQANHIHSGSCTNLGSVEYPLTDMADGISMTVVDATLASLKTGDFAINLHKIEDLSVYTSCVDIPTEAEVVTIVLDELNGSGQTGIATLVAKGDQTDVVLMATPGLSRANHIHTGSCADLGGIADGLIDMADGLSVVTANASLNSLRTGGFAINLHKNDDPSIYTSCGNIPATALAVAPGAELVIPMWEMNNSGQAGVAVLRAQGDKTQVVLQATANISKANHVNTGTCANLGGVAYALTDMANGSSVTTVNASLDSLRTGGFAVVGRDRPDHPSIYTSCGDIPVPGNDVKFDLEEKNNSGQSGVASLIAQGDMTEVVLWPLQGSPKPTTSIVVTALT